MKHFVWLSTSSMLLVCNSIAYAVRHGSPGDLIFQHDRETDRMAPKPSHVIAVTRTGRKWATRLLTAALLALGLPGCATGAVEHDLVYHADLSFTTEERIEIQRGAYLLATVTGHPVEVVFDGADADRTILRMPNAEGASNMNNEWLQTIHVGIRDTGSHPEISSSAQDVGLIVTHELGHGLGMDHVSDLHALMAPKWLPGGFKWTAADVENCNQARARGWTWKTNEIATPQ